MQIVDKNISKLLEKSKEDSTVVNTRDLWSNGDASMDTLRCHLSYMEEIVFESEEGTSL